VRVAGIEGGPRKFGGDVPKKISAEPPYELADGKEGVHRRKDIHSKTFVFGIGPFILRLGCRVTEGGEKSRLSRGVAMQKRVGASNSLSRRGKAGGRESHKKRKKERKIVCRRKQSVGLQLFEDKEGIASR